MKSHKSAKSCRRLSPASLGVVCALLSIVAVTAGALALSSCATEPKAVQRELEWATVASNAVVQIGSVAGSLPQPIGAGVTLVATAALAGLGAWISHLHRSIAQLNNGSPQGKAEKLKR
jgi:hypothetical protein